MKIARYRYQSEESYGILNGQSVLCLPALAKCLKTELPKKLGEFIAAEDP